MIDQMALLAAKCESMSDRCAEVQTKLYGLINNERLAPEVLAVLLECHGELGTVVYDGMRKSSPADEVWK